jgi:ureidoacrylate peracid hydrolase
MRRKMSAAQGRETSMRSTWVVSVAVLVLLFLTTGAFGLTREAGPSGDVKADARDLDEAQGRPIGLDAKPDTITLDLAKTAVIVVDMQNDFGSKGGMFDRAGIDISGIQKAIGPTAKVLTAARKANVKIIYLKMGYKPDLSDLGAPNSVNRVRHLRLGVGNRITAPDGRESRILIRDTWNTDIVSELKPQSGDDVLYKTRFSGFFETDLDARLKKLGVTHLIITGCTTSICVDSTVRDAMFRDYLCVLLADCMSEPIGSGLPRSNHDASLLSAEVLLGWVSDSERFLKAIQL